MKKIGAFLVFSLAFASLFKFGQNVDVPSKRTVQSISTQCVEDLCGGAKDNVGLGDLYEMLSPKSLEANGEKKKIAEKVSALVDFEVTKLEKFLKVLNSLDDTVENLKLSQKLKRYINNKKYAEYFSSFASKYMSEEMDLFLSEDTGDIFLPEEEMLNMNIPVEDHQWFLSLLSKRHFRGAYDIFMLEGAAFFEDIIYGRYPGLEYEEARIKMAEEALSVVQEARAEVNGAIRLSSFYLEKVYGGELNVENEKFYQEARSAFTFQYMFSEDHSDLVESREINLKFLLGGVKRSEEYVVLDAVQEGSASTREWVQSYKDVCTSSLSAIVYSSNTKEQNQKLEEIKDDIMKTIKSDIAFSKMEEKDFFEKELSKFEIKRSPTRTEVKSDIYGRLESLSNGNNLTDDEVGFEKLLLWAVSLKPFNKETQTEQYYFTEQVFSDLKNMCFSGELGVLSDEINQENGKAKVTWPVARYPEIGVGVLAHEIAHYVSSILKRQELGAGNGKYYLNLTEEIEVWEKRRCISTYYENTIGIEKVDRINKAGEDFEGYFTEEDWADYLAGRVLKKLSVSGSYSSLKNYMCTFLEVEPGIYQEDFQIQEPPAYMEDAPLAPHSPKIIRALNVEKTWKGKLPASCEKKMEEHKLFQCSESN